MTPLREVRDVRQILGEPRQRWFTGENVELVLWCSDDGAPVGFQLCYDRRGRERALTWTPAAGFVHAIVDDGEGARFRHKGTPILRPDAGDPDRAVAEFAAESVELPADVAAFVRAKLDALVTPPSASRAASPPRRRPPAGPASPRART